MQSWSLLQFVKSALCCCSESQPRRYLFQLILRIQVRGDEQPALVLSLGRLGVHSASCSLPPRPGSGVGC
ncbi:UNVERIFIED_CONTAM: hypothetical protein FKN15_023652 [Acipenser sinensis]